ncbi:MAG TPA: DUF4349 domain-containing protein [Spirochaetota bacterium]|nr:DUF4349 domain-containing protein [Spirochaetota bacterium]HNU92103.1 DUF4349 domain-containing protein [Spirochaetota bacterium]HPV97709.1 DUF4349 domain-containing protein [Spirochaetota bacterium]
MTSLRKEKCSLLASVTLALCVVLSACGSLGGRGENSARSAKTYASAGEYDEVEGASGMLGRQMKAERAAPSPKRGVKSEPAPSERMVVYTADFSLEVESIRQSLDRIEGLARGLEGFIESVGTSDSYRGARVVLRVPVKKFEKALEEVEKLGAVADRSVTASDVTMEFNDITLRLETTTRVRDRMYELLKRVGKVEERVKILREIQRLTEQIDLLTARVNYLAGRARFSTISLNLKAAVRDTVRSFIPSPFPWIAGLSPEKRSVFDDGKKVSFDVPAGFFSMKRDYYEGSSPFLFSAPDGSLGVRLGLVENYPPADIRFWVEAFEIDVKNRMYRLEKSDELSGQHGLSFKRYLFVRADGGLYMVAFAEAGGYIWVAEAVSRSGEDYRRNAAAIESFIKSVRGQQ